MLAILLTTACTGSPYDAAKPSSERQHPQQAPTGASSAPAFVPAAPGDVTRLVHTAVQQARGDGQRILVYVGASWCEPCRRFHDAVERGQLDEALAGVRFVEFDADVDNERLHAAGYGGRLIPRFAVPGPDGRGAGLQIEGGVKGDGAVEHIMKRLRPLLERTSAG